MIFSGALGVSQPSLWRALRPLIQPRKAIQLGVTRGARYALRRTVAEIGSAWPLYRIGRQGEVNELGTVSALAADQYFVDGAATMRALGNGGVTDGLPYFLQDQRPGGFLGRAVPTRYAQLRLPPRVIDWSNEHYLRHLTRHRSDTVGCESAVNEPMLFAPQNDQIVARVFSPPEPTANSHRAWAPARELAERYWQALSEDLNISAGFRKTCAACLSTLQGLPRTGAYAPAGP
jgi:hypothetical protein